MDTVAEVLWCSVSPAESPRTKDETETEIGSLGANTYQYVTCLWSVQVTGSFWLAGNSCRNYSEHVAIVEN
ncbi:hypothetical protein IFM47457_07321 [Aspergillus lentulus]|nr:hypothetical protein IFM47457_07321 [Aspergillus lentulus]